MTYRPCKCGHGEGSHQSNGSSFPHPLIFGVCLEEGCDCREYVAAATRADDASGAARMTGKQSS